MNFVSGGGFPLKTAVESAREICNFPIAHGLFSFAISMKRNHWLLLTVALLVVGNIVWYFWSNWGLITIHSKDKPLGEIIRSIEKQGHVTIKTNIDLSKPIQMYVDKVALAEALETLSVVAEGRWRLTYVVAPDKGTISNALSNLSSGQQRPEGWLSKYVPLRAMGPMGMAGAEPEVLPDPRKDKWAVKPASEGTLQAYLEQASRNVSASFMVQEQWNPAIGAPPSSGPISKVLPKLISKANGRYEEVFLITAERMRADGDPRPPDDEDRRAQFREAMDERIQNEINKLPPAQRAAAQQDRDEQKQIFEMMRNLPPDERAAKMQEIMSDPKMQQKIEDANLARDARRSPQQRMQRGNQYVQRLAAARAAATGQ